MYYYYCMYYLFHIGCCVCCTSCLVCGRCNSKYLKDQQCIIYRLVTALDKAISLRNTFSHLNLNQMNDFLNNGQPFSRFSEILDWNDLTDLFREVYMEIVSYLSLFEAANNRETFIIGYKYKIERIIIQSSEEITKIYHKCILRWMDNFDRDSRCARELKQMKCIVEELVATVARSPIRDGKKKILFYHVLSQNLVGITILIIHWETF